MQASFPAFASVRPRRLQWAQGAIHDPVLVTTTGEQITGAIGPMRTDTDASGAIHLLPQYFAVAPQHRRHGAGGALWRAAQRWGHQTNAAYQLLQATTSSAARRLYARHGARPLGGVSRAPP